MIEVKGIYKSFGHQEVLRGVDMQVSPGEIAAVLGPNGSGKTTLLKSILGMVRPHSGVIRVGGEVVNGSCDYRNDIGYLPQIARFPENLRVKELVYMVGDLRKKKGDTDALIGMLSLAPFMEVPLRHLSGGTRQKVNILLAFMFGTKYYILDEPTAGLDPLSLIRFKDLLGQEKTRGKAILLTTHIISLVEEIADRVIFLLEGKVFFSGTVKELKARNGGNSLEEAIARILNDNPNA